MVPTPERILEISEFEAVSIEMREDVRKAKYPGSHEERGLILEPNEGITYGTLPRDFRDQQRE
jgi:hypothetical protein